MASPYLCLDLSGEVDRDFDLDLFFDLFLADAVVAVADAAVGSCSKMLERERR